MTAVMLPSSVELPVFWGLAAVLVVNLVLLWVLAFSAWPAVDGRGAKGDAGG